MLTQTVKLSEGVKLKKCNKYLNCNVCSQEKSKVIPANRLNGFKTTEPLQVIFADLIGPMKPSLGGACYILSILDNYSRYGFCYLPKNKTETFQNFFNWLRFAERKMKRKVITLVTDNGAEFVNTRFQTMLKQAGTEHKRSAPYRPQHMRM
uniref:Integrase catalytic domain-containing protein n=1 Tax=Micrurus corallinus TaxID=54390 RepID=A0A2D4ERR0_MICCO